MKGTDFIIVAHIIKIVIDHQMRGDSDGNSDGLKWPLNSLSLESKIL